MVIVILGERYGYDVNDLALCLQQPSFCNHHCSALGEQRLHLYFDCYSPPAQFLTRKVDVPVLLNKFIWDQDMTDLRMYLKLGFSQTCTKRRSS